VSKLKVTVFLIFGFDDVLVNVSEEELSIIYDLFFISLFGKNNFISLFISSEDILLSTNLYVFVEVGVFEFR
jgi:hypothetical protein